MRKQTHSSAGCDGPHPIPRSSKITKRSQITLENTGLSFPRSHQESQFATSHSLFSPPRIEGTQRCLKPEEWNQPDEKIAKTKPLRSSEEKAKRYTNRLICSTLLDD